MKNLSFLFLFIFLFVSCAKDNEIDLSQQYDSTMELDSRNKEVACKGCNAIEFSSHFIRTFLGCCEYELDYELLCEIPNFDPSNYSISIFRNGGSGQSLSTANGFPVEFTICEGESAIIEIRNGRGGLCFTKELSCSACCPVAYDTQLFENNEGCCEITFTMSGDALCLASMEFIVESDGQPLQDLNPDENIIQIVSCLENSVNIYTKNENGDLCFENTISNCVNN